MQWYEYIDSLLGNLNSRNIIEVWFNDTLFPTVIYIFAIFILSFIYINHVSDKYLSENVIGLYKSFGINPEIAAITIVAFSNGAPDIIAAFINAKHESIFDYKQPIS